jgi:hypothetical protein
MQEQVNPEGMEFGQEADLVQQAPAEAIDRPSHDDIEFPLGRASSANAPHPVDLRLLRLRPVHTRACQSNLSGGGWRIGPLPPRPYPMRAKIGAACSGAAASTCLAVMLTRFPRSKASCA